MLGEGRARDTVGWRFRDNFLEEEHFCQEVSQAGWGVGKATGSRMAGALFDLALKMPTLLEHSVVGRGSSFLQTKQGCGSPVPDLAICSHREGESATSHPLSLSKGRPGHAALCWDLRILGSQIEVHRS